MTSFFEYAIEIAPVLLRGASMTLQIVALAIVLGIALGVLVGLARVYAGRTAYAFCTVYVEAIRGTPLLVQLFLLYFGLPSVGIYISSFWAAVIGMGINSGAYQSEYFRGAIQSIRSGQMLAARSIGMNRRQAIQSIIVPQMLRRALPSWSNELMYMIKYSSLAYMIQTPELMAAAKEMSAQTFRTFETFLLAGLIYLVIVAIVSRALMSLENRIKIPGL
ncbi:MAG: amino acid ABC transporter permease [Rhodospirillales bacterium]|nr:amino acid ABC transporter permease [Rhodospirillales bacterium]